jgi:hypothetical protein
LAEFQRGEIEGHEQPKRSKQAGLQEDFTALADIVHAIAKGDFNAVDRLYELQGQNNRPQGIVDLAESIGMLLVRMEAGEFHMERPPRLKSA